MTLFTAGDLSQDEQTFFEFILKTPNQWTALELINGAMPVLTKQLREAVQTGDFIQQRILNAKCKFLYGVAVDRNSVYQEHEFVDALEWIHGIDSRRVLLLRQSEWIRQLLASNAEKHFLKSQTERQCWEAKVMAAEPSWGPYRGKANPSIQCALGASRVAVLDMTLAMTGAYVKNRRSESWHWSQQLAEAKTEFFSLEYLANQSSAYRIAGFMYGKEAADEIRFFVDTYSTLPRFRQMQFECRDNRYKGFLRYPSIRKELELEFLGDSDKEAA